MNRIISLGLACAALTSTAFAQGTAFTYQGRLNEGGVPANGLYDLFFGLCSNPTNGVPFRADSAANHPVSNGLFSVTIDFGQSVFNGTPLWLQIAVAPGGTGRDGYTNLAPRQALTAAPYALFAPNAGVAQTVPDGAITSNKLAPNSVTPTQLAPGAAAANLGTNGIGSVPSGTVVLSQLETNEALIAAGFIPLGGSISNSGDATFVLPSGPPPSGSLTSARYNHRAIWTGTEMLIIGGTPDNAGLRYNPSGNSWSLINKTNAPEIGDEPLIAWTGSQLIVWDAYNREGARYSPSTDSWTAMNDIGSPSARVGACAAFANGYFVVWGGSNPDEPDLQSLLITGARYNVANNTWSSTTTANAPTRRAHATATAAGSEIIVIGGQTTNTVIDCGIGGCSDPFLAFDLALIGARYNPAANTWTAIAQGGGGVLRLTAWTGTDLYIWGGVNTEDSTGLSTWGIPLNGARYNLAGNSWTPLGTNGQPASAHVGKQTMVWNGSSMIVWGMNGGFSYTNIGARYVPASDSWVPLAHSVLEDREEHTAVWTGTQMIIWGGKEFGGTELGNGARYNSAGNTWSSMSSPPATGEPSARQSAAGVWAGDALVMWGGENSGVRLRSGGIYRPAVGWTNTPQAGAPSARDHHTAVWTGTEMIIWGGLGVGSVPLNTGARFHVASNRWVSMTSSNAPRRRTGHSAIWTGTEMIIFGGYDRTNSLVPTFLNSAARYNPSNDRWTAITNNIFILPRAGVSAVWSGTEMIIWGGYQHNGGFFPDYNYFNSGLRFNPASNLWSTIASSGLSGRRYHSAVWAKEEMIIWGGFGTSGFTNTGARYNPASNTWTPLPTTNAPYPRAQHAAAWDSGHEWMLIVAGDPGSNSSLFESMYSPSINQWIPNTFSSSALADFVSVWDGQRLLVSTGRDGNHEEVDTGRIYRPRRYFYYYVKQ